eukprot:NODE_4405_length_1068_cov_128.024339_g4206_i0.p1 GENE.NODE_4405_length_1068_cov_128.024339_g4206_i0~~NODE_4405_length_1068_cov_128.024339_g4206_i0.p1  ORF type:complete len:316 (-),score=14.54 NODE_4405_length_1068_cov_128.024339_g4206_i0:71-1018(-)
MPIRWHHVTLLVLTLLCVVSGWLWSCVLSIFKRPTPTVRKPVRRCNTAVCPSGMVVNPSLSRRVCPAGHCTEDQCCVRIYHWRRYRNRTALPVGSARWWKQYQEESDAAYERTCPNHTPDTTVVWTGLDHIGENEDAPRYFYPFVPVDRPPCCRVRLYQEPPWSRNTNYDYWITGVCGSIHPAKLPVGSTIFFCIEAQQGNCKSWWKSATSHDVSVSPFSLPYPHVRITTLPASEKWFRIPPLPFAEKLPCVLVAKKAYLYLHNISAGNAAYRLAYAHLSSVLDHLPTDFVTVIPAPPPNPHMRFRTNMTFPDAT